MKMKKQDKGKKVGTVKKSKKQIEERSRTVEKPFSAASRVTQETGKGTQQETAAEEAVVSSGQVMPRAEGKLAGRTQSGMKPLVAVKPSEDKPVAGKEAATGKAPVAGSWAAATPPSAAKKEAGPLGIKKEYSQSRALCKVTFRLPAAAASTAKKVTVVGDFNGWNRETTSLKKQENGDFAVTLDLHAGREYRFRYLIDGKRWENDWCADKYVMSPYGGDDSVVCL
jgi:hypothetical protein